MRRPYVQCFRASRHICRERCTRESTKANACQLRARTEDLIIYLCRSGSDTTLKKRRVATGLPKEALSKISLSECPSITEGLQFVQKDTLTSAYGIFGFE